MRRAVAQANLTRHIVALERTRARIRRGRSFPGSGIARCSSRSISAEAVYSTVPKPWLNWRAANSRCSKASGIASPVSAMARITPGRSLRRRHPVLENLRRELGTVLARRTAVCRIARDSAPGSTARTGVAEFVERWPRRRQSLLRGSARPHPEFDPAKLLLLTTIGATQPSRLSPLGRGNGSTTPLNACRAQAKLSCRNSPTWPPSRSCTSQTWTSG